jgi:hypothetical protein
MSLFTHQSQRIWQGCIDKDDSAILPFTIYRMKEVNRWDVFMFHLWPRSGFLGCFDFVGDGNTPCNLCYSNEDTWEYPLFDDFKSGNNTLTLYKIQGVTKDSAGNPLGNCGVELFRASDDLKVGEGISDINGNYLLYTPYPTIPHYCVSFKDPNLTGATVRTLVGQA